jgi:ABC-2 type transport system permease protein
LCERERGTIEQLIVTPIRPRELVVGKLIPYVLLTMVDAVEILAIGGYGFEVIDRDNLGLVFLYSAQS